MPLRMEFLLAESCGNARPSASALCRHEVIDAIIAAEQPRRTYNCCATSATR